MNKQYADSILRAKSLYANFHDVIHDWEHSQRVANNTRLIADSIGFTNIEFLELCALWHDSARTQGYTDGHEEQSALLAEKDLTKHGVDEKTAERVYKAIRLS